MRKSTYLILSTLSVLTMIFALYFLIFHKRLSLSSSDWGNFGSYLAGTAGVLFSLVNFVLIFFTFKEQRKDSFENIFAQLISNYNNLLTLINERWLHKDLDSNNNVIYRKGREIFGNVMEYIKNEEDIEGKFVEIYYIHINVFLHYINFISEAIETIKVNTAIKDFRKDSYYKRFSSQLSYCELLFIAYYLVYPRTFLKNREIIRGFILSRLSEIPTNDLLPFKNQFEFIIDKLKY
jgi:hypothetical protein